MPKMTVELSGTAGLAQVGMLIDVIRDQGEAPGYGRQRVVRDHAIDFAFCNLPREGSDYSPTTTGA